MHLVTITDQHRIDTLTAAAAEREQEIFGYQINIDNYTIMLAALPAAPLPDRLASHAAMPTEALPPAMEFADVQLIADCQYRDRIAQLLRCERIEQSKARRVLNAIKAQLPAGQADTLMVAHSKSNNDQ
jgi:hypothetical protein